MENGISWDLPERLPCLTLNNDSSLFITYRVKFLAWVMLIKYIGEKNYIGKEFSEIHVNVEHYVGEICKRKLFLI